MNQELTNDGFTAQADDLDLIREIAELEGFCLVRNAFTPQQLERMLQGMRSYYDAAETTKDLLSFPALRWVLFEPVLMNIARALSGDQLVYYGQSQVNFEPTKGALTFKPYNELHCDAVGLPKELFMTWAGPDLYRGYRFGIYFQDYTYGSGGLKVVPGSHVGVPEAYRPKNFLFKVATRRKIGTVDFTMPDTRSPIVNIRSRPGDLVIWNLRTFHAAGAKLFVEDPTIAVHPEVEDAFNAQNPDVFFPPVGPRNALFLDYGTPVEEIDLYIKSRALREIKVSVNPDMATYDSEEAEALASAHGVELRYDGLIVALALQLSALREGLRNGAATPVSERERMEHEEEAVKTRLLHVLRRHREYSPHFQLFDRQAFQDTLASNPEQAITTAVAQIVTLRETLNTTNGVVP